jgi:protein gp37
MSDLFHDDVPDEYIARVFAVMAWAHQHTFQVLTKRHARMRSLLASPEFLDLCDREWCRVIDWADARLVDPEYIDTCPIREGGWPLPNVWLGVSVENQQWADIRIPALINTPAAVRFLSCEPLLGPVNLTPGTHSYLDYIDWVIVGGESGRGARPMHPDWARSLRDECETYGVPFFMKQTGTVLAREWGLDGKGDDASKWPETFPQEYPNAS